MVVIATLSWTSTSCLLPELSVAVTLETPSGTRVATVDPSDTASLPARAPYRVVQAPPNPPTGSGT